MKTKIIKSSILIAILGVTLWSCKKDITTTNPESEISLKGLEIDIFNHTFTFNRSEMNSASAILELENFSDAILKEVDEFKSENEYDLAGILINFNFNNNGDLVATLQENTNGDSGFFEVIDNLSTTEEWTDYKKCRSKDCVGSFVNEMIEKYDGCAVFKIVRHTFSAEVYASPC